MSSSTKEKGAKNKRKNSKSSSSSAADDALSDDACTTATAETTKSDKNNDDKSKKARKAKKKLKKKKSIGEDSVGSGSSYYYSDSDSSLSSSGSEISLLTEEVKNKKFRKVMAKEASKSSLLDSASMKNGSYRRQSMFSDEEEESSNREEDELSEFEMDLTFVKSSGQNNTNNNNCSPTSCSVDGAPESSNTTTTNSPKKTKLGRVKSVDSDDQDSPKDGAKVTSNKDKRDRKRKESYGDQQSEAISGNSDSKDNNSAQGEMMVFDWASVAEDSDKKKSSKKSTSKKDKYPEAVKDMDATEPTLRRIKSSGDSSAGFNLFNKKSTKNVRSEEEVTSPKRKSKKLSKDALSAVASAEEEGNKKKGKKCKEEPQEAEGKESKKKKGKKEAAGEERRGSGGTTSGELQVEVEKHDWQALAKAKDKKEKRHKTAEKDGGKGRKKSLDDGEVVYNWSPKKTSKSPKKSKLKKTISTGSSLLTALPLISAASSSRWDNSGGESKKKEKSKPKLRRWASSDTLDTKLSTSYYSDGDDDTVILALKRFTRQTSFHMESKEIDTTIATSKKTEKPKTLAEALQPANSSTTVPSTQGSDEADGDDDTVILELKKLTHQASSNIESEEIDTSTETAKKMEISSSAGGASTPVSSSTTIPATQSPDRAGETLTEESCKSGKAVDEMTDEEQPPTIQTAGVRDQEDEDDSERTLPINNNSGSPIAQLSTTDTSGRAMNEGTSNANGGTTGDLDLSQECTDPSNDGSTGATCSNALSEKQKKAKASNQDNSIQTSGSVAESIGEEKAPNAVLASLNDGDCPLPGDIVMISEASSGSESPKQYLVENMQEGKQDQEKAGKPKRDGVSKSPKKRKKKSIAKLSLELQQGCILDNDEEEEDSLVTYVNSILKMFTDDPKQYSDEAIIALLQEFPQAASMKFHLKSSQFRGYLLSLICRLGGSREATAMCFNLNPDAIHKFDEHIGTPLHHAISFGILASFSREMWTESIFETVEFLLKQEPRLLSSQHNEMHQSALHQAISSLYPPTEGLAPGIKSAEDQQHLAGISDVVISLLLEGNNLSATLPDAKNLLPLHLAALCVVPVDILRRLLGEYEEACTVKCHGKGFTPLHYAVQAFAEAASVLNDSNSQAPTASFDDHVANIEALVRGHADATRVEDINGDLPLHILVSTFYGLYSLNTEHSHCDDSDSAFVKVTQRLSNAFPEAINIHGSHRMTPLMIVQKHKGDRAVVNVLINATLPKSVASESSPK